MADSDKQILITPNVSQTSQPEIKFVGKDNSPVYLKVLDDNTLSFEGSEGQVFSIGPTLSSGDIFSVSDISGVQSMAVNADGTITLDAQSQEVTIKNTASDSSTLILENSNADANRGPVLELYRNSVSPADADKAGAIIWYGNDDAGNKQELGQMYMYYNDVSNSGEDAELIFQLTEAGGVQQEYFRIRGGSRQISFNTMADDIDMTWDGDTTADLMFWDAGNERVGINTGTSVESTFHVNGTIQSGEQGGSYFATLGGNALTFNRNSTSYIDQAVTNGDIAFRMDGTTVLWIDGADKVGIKNASPKEALHVEGNILAASNDTADTTKDGRYMFLSEVATNIWTGLYGYSGDGYNSLYLGGGTGSGEPATTIRFHTGTHGTEDAGTERMHITAAGLVGIGTSSPMNLLQVSHTGADGNNGILIVREDTSTAANDMLGGIGFDSTDGNVPSSVLEASVAIIGRAREAHGTGDKGGYLDFYYSPTDQNDDTSSRRGMRFMDGKFFAGTDDQAINEFE